MAEFDRTNTGTFSKNERKTTDSHPDVKGQANIDGVEYWIDAWMKERNSDGSKFYSVKFKRKDAQAPQPTHGTQPKRPAQSLDDDSIPF